MQHCQMGAALVAAEERADERRGRARDRERQIGIRGEFVGELRARLKRTPNWAR